MRLKSILAGLALALVAALPAQAQRGPGGGGPGTWELLGEEKVGFGSDRDRVEIRQQESWWRDKSFRALRFIAAGGDVKIRRIILNYQNGHSEELDFKGDIRAGQQIDVPLRGERSYLSAIDFDYASKINLRFGSGGIGVGQATMRIYGENMRAGAPPVRVVAPPPPPAPGGGRGGWDNIGNAAFDRRDDSVWIPVGRREGRIGQIRLVYNGDGGVVIKEIRVRFSNGEAQAIPVAERLEDGYSTKGFDLEGDRRFIERIAVLMEPRSRSGRGNFIVEGNERPGREVSEPPRRGEGRVAREGWELLGRQTVGFGVDRDTIKVNQNANWWSQERRYRRIHFTAENSEIYLNSVRLRYINGHTEQLRVEQLIREGGDFALDLGGERGFISDVEMTYRSRPGAREQAVMSVYGERGRR